MPIVPPRLDDRSFQELVDELVARIPAHTPEWTHAAPGDPGRTLLELFAWMADGLLYRANLIPERQRMAFLRLLGIPVRPAVPAGGVISVHLTSDDATTVDVPIASKVKGPVLFETRDELTVLPCVAEVYCKRLLTTAEAARFDAATTTGLQDLYGLKKTPSLYATTPVFADGVSDARGFDLAANTADGCLWLALLAPKPDQVDAVRAVLGAADAERPRILNIGFVPGVEVPSTMDARADATRVRHVWELPVQHGDRWTYRDLTVAYDGTRGLTTRGVARLVLPGVDDLRAPENDPRRMLTAGAGDLPPRLDDPKRRARLVTWIRLRVLDKLGHFTVGELSINATAIDQHSTLDGLIVGYGDGTPNQSLQLGQGAIDVDTFALDVAEDNGVWLRWQRVDDLALAARDQRVYALDAEIGVVQFGDGIRAAVLPARSIVRAATMRAGGGAAGNLAPASLTAIDVANAPPLRVQHATATFGGEDAESLDDAERRIPSTLRHGQRAVTAEDYRRVAAETPGAFVARAEVLPRFLPHQRMMEVPGVVSVMVLPRKAVWRPPAPRPDRPFIERVRAWLDARRPLATELYVIGAEYVPIGVGVAITVREGFGPDAVTRAVTDALHRFLWPLAPGGPQGQGWPLGRAVRDRELEVLVAHVEGIDTVAGVSLFGPKALDAVVGADGVRRFVKRPLVEVLKPGAPRPRTGDEAPVEPPREPPPLFLLTPEKQRCDGVILGMQPWQLPELLQVKVVVANAAPTTLDPEASNGQGDTSNLVPVVPEVC